MSERNASDQSSVLLIGGPDTGKSNYIFRLWMDLDAEQHTLAKNGLPDELEYLRTGAECLMNGTFAARTPGEVVEHVSVPVRLRSDAAHTGVLHVPDVPGERILEAYRRRKWDNHWEERVQAECGCLVFMRASSPEIVPSLDYAACVEALGAPLPARNATAGQPGRAPATTTEAPTDIVLTEWVQFLRRAYTDRVGGNHRPRIGLVVAAWDAVPNDFDDRDPSDYVAAEFPLLYQFMSANEDCVDCKVFGLSIVSGDLTNDSAFKARFEQGTPTDFGYVIHSLGGAKIKANDVTIPVAWALGWLPTGATPKGSS